MTRPGTPSWGTYLRDSILFAFGVALVMKQAGMYFAPPTAGPSIPLIVVGALFCNGPVVLQALALRFGTGSRSDPPPPSEPPPQPGQLSVPSSGGE